VQSLALLVVHFSWYWMIRQFLYSLVVLAAVAEEDVALPLVVLAGAFPAPQVPLEPASLLFLSP
jgi:hypothetical protein